MTANRIVTILCLLGILAFSLLRLVELSADPPAGLTTSGVLYTDEGQYARNAVRWILTGHWYAPGDFNPGVLYPVATAIQMLAFRLLGLSTASARAVTIFFSWLTLYLTYRVCRYYVSATSSLVAVLLMAASYRFFAYSRIALLDIPMIALALWSLVLGISGARQRSGAIATLSALAFMASLWTKLGIYLLPLILFAIVREAGSKRWAAALSAVWSSACAVLFAVYYLFLARPYALDYRYMTQAVASLVRPVALDIARNSVAAVYHTFLADPILALAVAGGVILLLFTKASFRANPLFHLAAVWALCRVLSLGTTPYQPPRYLLPMHVPLAMATACVVQHMRRPQDGWTGRPVFAVLLVAALALNAYAIVSYIAQPRFTFVSMCADIRYKIASPTRPPSPVIMGNLADSISLEIRVPAVNDRLGTADLATRVRLYGPTHYVSLGPVEPDARQVLEEMGEMRLLELYDIYNNYYTDEPVYFYALETP